jgi:hypothetical protein
MKTTGSSLPISNNNKDAGNEPPPRPFDPIKWARDNPWLVEGQPDDRLPVNGAVTASGGTAAEQRSFARSTHQAMFKKWSQARHD